MNFNHDLQCKRSTQHFTNAATSVQLTCLRQQKPHFDTKCCATCRSSTTTTTTATASTSHQVPPLALWQHLPNHPLSSQTAALRAFCQIFDENKLNLTRARTPANSVHRPKRLSAKCLKAPFAIMSLNCVFQLTSQCDSTLAFIQCTMCSVHVQFSAHVQFVHRRDRRLQACAHDVRALSAFCAAPSV